VCEEVLVLGEDQSEGEVLLLIPVESLVRPEVGTSAPRRLLEKVLLLLLEVVLLHLQPVV
jgi:hypothetical protein